jgi:hypothetical protein
MTSGARGPSHAEPLDGACTAAVSHAVPSFREARPLQPGAGAVLVLGHTSHTITLSESWRRADDATLELLRASTAHCVSARPCSTRE